MIKNDAFPFADVDSYHGGIDFEELARLGISPDRVIDFSSNILPFGPSPLVKSAIRQVALDRYPDRECRDLRQRIAELHSIDQQRILVGNGCSELIHLLASTLLGSSDHVLVVGPTFSEYGRATRFTSATMHQCRATVDSGFAVPVNEIASRLAAGSTTLVWICNPNNPTGKLLAAETILRWVKLYPRTLFIVDESYIEFSDSAASLVQADPPNLVVLRSMTKSMAIAGLRLGFLVASEQILGRLRERLVPWNVNSLAQAAGIAAINDRQYYSAAISRLAKAKDQFMSDLKTRGYEPVSSDANYFLLPIDNASAVREGLLSHGILVRDCASFGTGEHIRLAVRAPADNEKLIRLLSPRDQSKCFG